MIQFALLFQWGGMMDVVQFVVFPQVVVFMFEGGPGYVW